MTTFYTDKSKLFSCLLEVDGAPLSEASARLILEVNGREFIFDCTIDNLGNCTVTIPPLVSYNVLGIGTMTLEVEVEDVLFVPYTDTIEVLVPTTSGYNDFISQTNYDGEDLLYRPTWYNKKVYSETPYIVLPNLKFNIAIGDTKPDLKFFIFKLGEQFGDPIPFPNLDTYTITVKFYDYNSNLIAFGAPSAINQRSGEIIYTFSPFDFAKSGIYFFEVELMDENGSVLTLPESNIKNEVIVRD